MQKSPPGAYEAKQVIPAVCRGRVSNVRPKKEVPPPPSLPPTHLKCVSASCLGKGALQESSSEAWTRRGEAWDAQTVGVGRGGINNPPHPQFLAFTATGSSAAKDSQGPGRPRPQPGGLAPRPLPGPAARPTRLTQPARGWLSGEQTLTSRTSQRRWPGFRQQLPVLEGDLGSSGPAHQTPRLAYHHVMTLHF